MQDNKENKMNTSKNLIQIEALAIARQTSLQKLTKNMFAYFWIFFDDAKLFLKNAMCIKSKFIKSLVRWNFLIIWEKILKNIALINYWSYLYKTWNNLWELKKEKMFWKLNPPKDDFAIRTSKVRTFLNEISGWNVKIYIPQGKDFHHTKNLILKKYT